MKKPFSKPSHLFNGITVMVQAQGARKETVQASKRRKMRKIKQFLRVEWSGVEPWNPNFSKNWFFSETSLTIQLPATEHYDTVV